MCSQLELELLCLYDFKSAPATFEKVKSDESQNTYTCNLHGHPKIDQLMVFTQGSWGKEPESIDIEINIVGGKKKKQKLCVLSDSQRCFQWTKQNASDDLTKVFGSNKLTLEASVKLKSQTSKPEVEIFSSPVGTKFLEEGQEMKKINEITPATEHMSKGTSPFPTKASKKRLREEENTPKPKSRRQKISMKALSSEKSPLAKQKLTEIYNSNISTVDGDSILKEQVKEEKIVRCVDLSSRAPKPSNRWGHTMCLVSSKQAVLIGGQGEKLSRDSIWILDPEMRTWKCPSVKTEGVKPECRIGHSATYDPTMRCIYVYGGSKNAKWFNDVHMFDLDEKKWTLVKVNGKAPTRAYHSATLYRHELWIFGGVFPRPDPQPDGCDNEMNIFSPVTESWYKPIVTGEKPEPRSGHSATLINDLLIVFGGWDFPYCYNDLFILDLTTVDWSQPKICGRPPKPRSWHASCVLSNERIFIHGGYDGDNPLHDAFIFDLESKSWQELVLENAPSARAGHTCLRLPCDYENREEDEVIVFGGGDNDGSYFSDMLSFYVPFRPKLVHCSE